MSIVGTSTQNARFSPADLPGLSLWLDGADSTSFTLSGSNVTAIRDKSPLALTVSVSSPAPTWSSSTSRFSFGNQWFRGNFPSTYTGTTLTAFAIATINAGAGNFLRLLSLSTPGVYDYSTSNSAIPLLRVDTGIGTFRSPTGTLASNAVTSGQVTLMTAEYTGSLGILYTDGVQRGSNTSTAAFSVSNFGVGYLADYGGTSDAAYWSGTIGEVLLYLGPLTVAQRQQVEGYLARKWGLTSVAGHPYRNGGPGILPTFRSGLQLWLDAADPSTVDVSGGWVTNWRDKSGNGIHFTSSRQTYSNNAINFAIGGFIMTSVSNVTLTTTSTLFIATKANPDAGIGMLMAFPWANGGDFSVRYLYSILLGTPSAASPGGVGEFAGNGGYTVNGSSNPSFDSNVYKAPHIISGTCISNVTTPITFSSLFLGDRNFFGDIYEVLLYSSVPTTRERQLLEGYLANKWGITGRLPAPTTPYAGAIVPMRSFSPLDVDGLALWLDAVDPGGTGTPPVDGTAVTTWVDKSGNGRNGVAGGTTPTYSNRAVTYGGSGYYSTTYSAAPANESFFVVFQWTTVQGQFISGTQSTQRIFYVDPPLSRWLYLGGSGVWGVWNTSALTSNIDYLAEFTWDGSTLTPTLYLNGTSLSAGGSVGSPATFTGTPSDSRIGNGFTGRMYEIVGYNRVLSATERQQVENYLAQKWGLRGSMGGTPHPFRYGPAVVTPTSIPGCTLWLDAADATTLTLSGSNVTQWRDKSGRANHANAAGTGTAPVLSTYNQLSAISWTATNQQLVTVSNSPVPGSAARTIFVVTHNPLSTSAFHMVTGTESGANPAIAWGYAKNANSDYTYPFLYASAGTDIYSNVQLRDGPTILTTTFDGTSNLTGWITSAYQIAKTGAINTATTPWYIGLRPSGNGSVDSLLLEFVVYSNALTTTQRQQIEGYLAWKWGLQTNLPGVSSNYGRIGRALTPTFVPTQVSGCALWLDAADRTTLALSGSNVTQWLDKSGNGRHATTAVGTPIVSTVSNRQGVYFNGTSAFTGSFSYSSNTLSWFVVGTVESDGDSYGRLLSLGVSGSYDFDNTSSINALSREGTTTELISYRVAYVGRGMTMTYGTPFVMSGVIDGASNAPYQNGVLATGSSTSGNFGFTTYGISTSIGLATQRNKGFVYEVLVFSNALTTSQRQRIEGYLAQKWGLTPVLGGTAHPYKYGPWLNLPTSIPGCVLWLDAADATTLTLSGSNVTQWNDKSGRGYALTVPAGGYTSPVYSNGLLNLSGSNALWTTTNFETTGNAQLTAFVVASVVGGTNLAVVGPGITIGFPNASTPVQTFGVLAAQDSNTTYLYAPATFGVDVGTSVTPNISGQRYLLSGYYNGSVVGGAYNGTALPSLTLTNANWSSRPLQIGMRAANSGSSVTGTFCEGIVYSGALTQTQIRQIEGYLAWKWGVSSNLPGPTYHPYRGFKP